MSDRPTTVRGYDAAEVVSALQKCIRRGEAEAAVYWAAELDRSGYGAWCWKRLRVIVSEDVGVAWPEGPAVIAALHATYSDLRRSSRPPHRLRPWRQMLTHAVLALATAPKSRAVDWLQMWAYSDAERREIPDFALDKHTARGRRMGRGLQAFFDEGSRLARHQPLRDEERWREQARVAIEAGGPQPDVAPSPQGSLFD